MNTFLKVIVFSLVILGGYVLFATEYIPHMEPSPPPVEEKLDLGAMTMDQFIALGDKIVHGKGTCTLCHNATVKRAPLFEASGGIPAVGVRASVMLKDPRYKGKAKNAAEYIEESMREPSAFVVAGFGVTGSNDNQSPMPVVTAGAIGLNDVEVKAVVAYLLNLSGIEVTVEIPKGQPAEEKKEAAPPAPAKTAEEFVNKFGCGLCHKMAGQEGAIAPDLTHIGTTAKHRLKDPNYKAKAKDVAGYITESILDSNAFVVPGFPPGIMPQDFKDRMTVGEFNLIVDYLVKSK